ncbi:MAG TPA: Maf family protein [Candidatus Tumulicola sp.]|nr:Maf family protein [Candidatus Tumulicola sp.]
MSERIHAIALASASPRRLALLQSIGLDVTVVRSAYEEHRADAKLEPGELVQLHAAGKAERAEPAGPALLIAADTLVAVGDEVLGKPKDAVEARSMLRRLSGRRHTVYTGFAVVDRLTGGRTIGMESTAVQFSPLSDGEIERYVATGEPLDKAGAYGIQGRGALLVTSIAGDFYTVMGLPLARVARACATLGYDLI